MREITTCQKAFPAKMSIFTPVRLRRLSTLVKYSNGNQSAVWGLTTMVPSWRSVIASSQQRCLLNGEATWDETALTADSCWCVNFWFRSNWKYNAEPEELCSPLPPI